MAEICLRFFNIIFFGNQTYLRWKPRAPASTLPPEDEKLTPEDEQLHMTVEDKTVPAVPGPVAPPDENKSAPQSSVPGPVTLPVDDKSVPCSSPVTPQDDGKSAPSPVPGPATPPASHSSTDAVAAVTSAWKQCIERAPNLPPQLIYASFVSWLALLPKVLYDKILFIGFSVVLNCSVSRCP